MMSYKDGFVVSVINQNKPIREFGESGKRIVHIPFGSEYKLRVKNNNYSRALARVTIDGTDVMTGGKMLVLKGYDSIDLERFVDDLEEGRRFKFISLEEGKRTGAIQDPSSPENGKVRVEFYREKLTYNLTWITSSTQSPIMRGLGGTFINSNDAGVYQNPISPKCFFSSAGATNCDTGAACSTSTFPDSCAGATAEGSASNQEFTLSTDTFETETEPVVIELWLKAPATEKVSDGWIVKIKPDGTIRVYRGDILVRSTDITLTDRTLRFKTDIGVVVETHNFIVS